jgi:hypothetical protein
VRFLVVRSSSAGAATHGQSKLKDAVQLASEFIADAALIDTITIIDTKTLALFEERQIREFAERFQTAPTSTTPGRDYVR